MTGIEDTYGRQWVDDAHWRLVPNLKDGGPGRDRRRPGRHPFQTLNLGLLRHFQGVVDLDPQVPHCTFKLGMA
jgi:hypothetical protein